MEKVKRVGEVAGMGWKPAAKVEFGERRVWFWEGCQGEREMEKEEMVVEVEVVVRRRREVRKRRREREKERGGERDMLVVVG